MKLDSTTLAIEPRTVGGCIDLAILFYRANARKMLTLTALFGAPIVAAGYLLTAKQETGWLWSLLLYFFVSPFLGAAVVAGAGYRVFGDPFTIRTTLGVLAGRLGALLVTTVLSRLVLAATLVFCWGVITVPIATRYGFLSEVILLEQLRGSQVGKRIGEIMRHTFWDACGRYVSVTLFAVAVFFSLFTLVDMGSGVLLGAPILLGKLSGPFFFEDLSSLLLYDPLVTAALSAIAWLVYPLARLAWFFCYLDARIRREGWDLEIAFRVEAQRLQAAT